MTPDERLDARILAELAKDPGTLLELSIRTEISTAVLLPRLQLLGGLKRVQCTREDGRLLWELVEEETTQVEEPAREPVHVEQPAPAHVEHCAADVPAPMAQPLPEAYPAGKQAIVVSGAVGSGANTVARDIARRIGGVCRKCTWSELVTPPGARALRDQPAVLVVDGMPDSFLARQLAEKCVAALDPQLIIIARSADAFSSHPAFAVVEVERKPTTERKPQVRHAPNCRLGNRTGLASAFELTMRFIAWAGALQSDPTPEQIRERWEVSRATAYRWLHAWQDAKGAVA